MSEVLTRRMRHEEWEKPDLILLDGGEGQVKAVLPLISGIPVVGRDKSGSHAKSAGTKIFVPGRGIVPLSNGSHAARLLARIDEEAHRFAITYHSLLKRKNMLK